jgi:hypothetical protein
MLGLAGVTAIETSVTDAGTVTVVVPESEPHTLATLQTAVIVAVPAPTALMRPLVLTVATDVLEDVQVRSVLKFCVVLSEKLPVAVNCSVAPAAMLELEALSVIDPNVAGVTVKVALLERLLQTLATLQVAVIVAVPVPAPTVLTSPLPLTVASEVFEEVQVRSLLTFWVVLSEKVAVAVICWLVPAAMLGIGGVRTIEDSVAGVTVTVKFEVTLPQTLGDAQTPLIIAVPAPTVLTLPLLLTVATALLDEVHVMSSVTSAWVLSA